MYTYYKNWHFLGQISIVTVLVAVLFMVFKSTSFETVTKDIFWHLEMGEDMVKRGIFPIVDDYTFSLNGERLSTFPYLFQILAYLLVSTFGYDAGMHLYMFGVFAATLVLVGVYAKQIRANALVVGMMIVGVTLFYHFRLLLRPELVSYLFMVVTFMLYKRSLDNFSWQNIGLNFTFLVVWSNYHTSIFGYVIFFGMYVDLGIKALLTKSEIKLWFKLIGSGLLLIVASFVNPFFDSPLVNLFFLDDEWKNVIVEYQNFFFVILNNYFRAFILVLAVATILYALKTRFYGYLTIAFILTINTILISRLVSATGIILILMLADMFSSESYLYSKSDITRKVGTVLSGGVSVLCMVFLSIIFTSMSAPNGIGNPEKLVDYFKDNNYKGNILNYYDVGGFLTYHLYPDAKIYIDGRSNILFDFDFFLHYEDVIRNPEILKAETEQEDINYLVLSNKVVTDNQAAYLTGLFSLDFVDYTYLLYKQGKTNFPISGFIHWSPYCWDQRYLGRVETELDIAKDIPGLSPNFVGFLENTVAYEVSENKVQKLHGLLNGEASNASIRFMAYQALKEEAYEYVIKYFDSIASRENKDYLLAAIAYLKQGNYSKAEDVIAQSNKAVHLSVNDIDRVLLFNLLVELEKDIEITKLPEGTREDLEKYFSDVGINPESYSMDYSIFCDKSLLGYDPDEMLANFQ